MNTDNGADQEKQHGKGDEGGEVLSGPNPFVAGVMCGALGAILGAVAGLFSLALFIDGLVINGTRVSAGEQILMGAVLGGVLGALVGALIAFCKARSD